MGSIILYHGSKDIVERPTFGLGKKRNDFGLGFYCTENKELAKEWAVSSSSGGYVNAYFIDPSPLNVLHLNTPKYTILNWIAILLEHRLFDLNLPNLGRARGYLTRHFGMNVNAYDIIIGYRADDSYFDYANAFLANAITVDQLALALNLGKLGEQVVIKSEAAFSFLEFQGFEEVPQEPYFGNRTTRDKSAEQNYRRLLEQDDDGLFLQDIIRGEISNDDPRIPRIHTI